MPPRSRGNLTLSTLAAVMQQHPLLNSHGIGVFDARRKTSDQRQADLTAGRRELVDREAMVMRVAAWLRENITSIQTPSTGSYHMKHVVERALGEYVSNGELIAAALVAGYSYKHTEGPNVELGMSARDVKRVESATGSQA